MSEGLRILQLGPALILAGDQPLLLSRRGLRNMLYFLACQTGPLSRGKLGLMFWNDLPEAQMRKNLRELLSRLRNELPDPNLLLVQVDTVQLDPQRVSSDMREFLDLYDQAARLFTRIPASSPLPDSVRELILRALSLWRANRFQFGGQISGSTELEEWVNRTEYRLLKVHSDLLERMVDHDIVVGRWESAVAWLRQAVEINPLEDNLHERLWTVLERSDLIDEAVAACQNTREHYTLAGIEFSPRLRAVCERLRSLAARVQGPQPGERVRRSLRVPLVGRQNELETLRLAFQRRSPVIVLGDTGSGKSRLLKEFAASVQPSARILSAAARVSGREVPFLPIADLLRGGLSAEEWRRLPYSWTTVLARLLPELTTLVPGITPPVLNSGLNLPILFDALYQVLLLVSEPQPLVIILDDVQWCDETTLGLLQYLLEKRFFAERAFVVLAVRVEEQQPFLTQFLHRFQSEFPATLVMLQPLTPEQVHEIIQLIFNIPASPELIDRMYRDTGGNPFVLLETLRAMLENSPDSLEGYSTGSFPLASSVHHLVRERIMRLSPDAQALLSLAAVAGSEFSLDLLESAGRYEPEMMVGLVEEIERAQLIQSTQGRASQPVGGADPVDLDPRMLVRYKFNQERVREIILMEISSARRRLFHLRVAEALKEQDSADPDAQAVVLAQHYQLAGEEKLAFRFWMKAAGHAGRLFSLAEQENHFKHAEKILSQGEVMIDAADILDLYIGWIQLGFTKANSDMTRRAGGAVLSYGWRRENREMIRTGLLGLAAAADLSENGAEGMSYLGQVHPFLESGTSLSIWMVYYYLRGGLLISLGRLDEAIEELENATSLVIESIDPETIEVRAQCGYRLSAAYLMSGWPKKAAEIAEKTLVDCRAVMSHTVAALAISTSGLANYYLGNYALADEQNKMVLRMAIPMQNPRLIGQVYANMAQLSLTYGHIDESWRQAGQALEVSSRANDAQIMAKAYRVQADIYNLLGSNLEAIPLYRKAVETGAETSAGMEALYRLGIVLVQFGSSQEGLAEINRCMEICQRKGIGLQRLFAQGTKALVLVNLGCEDEAVALAEEVAQQSVQRNIPSLRAVGLQVYGMRAMNQDRLDEARQKGLALAHQGRQSSNLFMEINGYQLALRAGDRLAEARKRFKDLMDVIDRNAQELIFRPLVDRMLARYAEALA